MHDFGNLVYLDLHKTGSSYVSEFLRHSCLLREKKLVKHDWIREDFRKEAKYFITVRNPINIYSSLYRYGLDRRGLVYNSLKVHNLLDNYASFDNFVKIILDKKYAKLLGYGYNEKISEEIGFISFRYMKLSLQYPMKKISDSIRAGSPLIKLKSQFITSYILKNEILNEELLKLSTKIFPDYFDVIKVNNFLSSAPRINASSMSPNMVYIKSTALSDLLKIKESLLLSLYT